MMPGRDGDALMRALAEQIENMGGKPTPPAAAPTIPFTGKELSPTVQTIAKITGGLIALVGIPALRGWAFQKLWRTFRNEELSYGSALALSFASHVAVKQYMPKVTVKHESTPKGM